MVTDNKEGQGGFSEESMLRKLRSLQGTADSIQGISGWIRHYQSAHPAAILKIWASELQSNRNPEKVLNLMYVANDVIQNSVRKNTDLKFATDFFGILGSALKHVAAVCTEDKKKKVYRILDVWDDRKTFPSKSIQTLRDILSGKRKSSKPPRKDLPTVTSVERELEMEQGPSSSTSVEDNESRMKKLSNLSKEFAECLRKLQDPPSIDGETRRKLASYPPAVSDPVCLKEIRNEAQADALLKQVNEAHDVLTDFCEKLSSELEDRRKLQSLLSDYEQCIKAELPENEKLCHDVKGILQRLEREKEEVLLHFNSIPDTDELAPTGAMPSLVDLFRPQQSQDFEIRQD